MNDDTFTALMTDLWGGGHPADDLWEIAMADDEPVFSDPDPRMEARCERASEAAYGDLLTTADLEGKHGVWWNGPQEDREDDTAEEHDEWTRDWNSTVESALPDRDVIRADHPFPIDLTDADGEDF